jgi:hemerythrin-like metal-binding protein
MQIGRQELAKKDLPCDSRYRSIINRLTNLIEISERESSCHLTKKLDHLLNSIMLHISSENDCMKLVRYPHITKHRSNHDFLCLSIADLCHHVLKGEEIMPDRLDFIRHLWLEHIQTHDKAFEEYLIS